MLGEMFATLGALDQIGASIISVGGDYNKSLYFPKNPDPFRLSRLDGRNIPFPE